MSIEGVLDDRGTVRRKSNTSSGITATVGDDSSETIAVSADGTLLVGMEIRIESEDLYITDVATGTVTATRGMNSTTPAAHTSKAVTILKDVHGQESVSYSDFATDVPCRVMTLVSTDQFRNGEGVLVTGQLWFSTCTDIEQEDEVTVDSVKYRVVDFDSNLMRGGMAQVANVVEVRV